MEEEKTTPQSENGETKETPAEPARRERAKR